MYCKNVLRSGYIRVLGGKWVAVASEDFEAFQNSKIIEVVSSNKIKIS